MRVLYFSRDYTTHDRRFLSKLAASRHTIYFLRLEDDGLPYEQRPLPAGIQAVTWPGGAQPARRPADWLALMPAFDTVVREIQPDLIHAGPVQSCGFMAAVQGQHPFMVMSWGSDILVDADRDDLMRWLTRYTLARADWLLCDCQAVRDKVQSIVPFADDRIVQFPWGIDLSRFPARPAREAAAGLFHILSTRSWEPGYGTETTLLAFEQAHRRDPRLRLTLLGSGALRHWVEAFVAEHALAEVVNLPGLLPADRLPDLFRATDLYLSTAPSDGTSISLLEAMATGLPAVVVDNPGNREWIVPGRNGWLVPAGDAAATATALLEAAAMPAALQQLGTANRQIALARANWDTNVAQLLAAYDRIAAGLPHS
jgi:glycosyltransferase involved in cell wall biosynthesis